MAFIFLPNMKSQVTNYQCVLYCAKNNSTVKNRNTNGYGVVEDLLVFKPADLTVCSFVSSLFLIRFGCSFGIFAFVFCSHEGTMPCRSSAHMPGRKESCVSFVLLDVLEPQIARSS
jgi:hypothetical protein